jgi:hypothetical protein
VYCNNDLAGGGWQLLSVRTADAGALFAAGICTDPTTDCSGWLPPDQRSPLSAPDLLFATFAGPPWLQVTGLEPAGSDGLVDLPSTVRLLSDNLDCDYPDYCGGAMDPILAVAASSAGYNPRFTVLPQQYVRQGGLWLGNGSGNPFSHVVSLNYGAYCTTGGLQLSDASSPDLGNVVCAEPGAIWFRY